MNNTKKLRAERPDKALFYLMAGIFFLLFSVAPAYWAFYNFGEYDQTKNFVEELKAKPEQFLTPDEKKEKESRIFFLSSRTDRYRLEMILSGAGSFVLFAVALLFFTKSWRAKNKRNFYEKVDLRSIPIPSAPIEIQHKKAYSVLSWLLVSFFVAMFLLIAYQSFSSRFISFENAVIRTLLFVVPIILFLAIFIFVQIRAKRNVALLIDNSGVTRGDGRHFAWQNFCGVITRTALNRRTQHYYVWRKELAFENGETTWVIPNRIKNYEEVFAYLEKLPPAKLKTDF